MPILNSLVATLAWLGRQGTRAIAAVVFIGIAVPPVGRLLDAVRRWWEDGDFVASRAECLVKLKELAAQP